MRERSLLACAVTALLLSAARPAAAGCEPSLRFIGMHSLAANERVGEYVVGGLSGLDYDPATHEWYLMSDDRSEHGPARFYLAELNFDSQQIADVRLLAARRLGALGPETGEIIDAESIRVGVRKGELLVAGESDERLRVGPWVRRVGRGGRWLGDITLPAALAQQTPPATRGPRPNRSLEGITYGEAGNVLWLSMEAPLLQDGPEASVDVGADVRFTRLRLSDGTFAQYVYPTDATRAHGNGESSDNGVSEILALNEHELLVLERSGTRLKDGHFRFHVRLYCSTWANATDVAAVDSLAGRTFRKMTKHLLFDFDDLPGVHADNVEGMSWGPDLATGERSLVFVTDNNFFSDVPTQFLFFAAHLSPQNRARAENVTVRGAPMK